jgi:hypothetical protein
MCKILSISELVPSGCRSGLCGFSLPEFLLCEAVQVCNVWSRLRVQVPLLAVGRAAGYAGQCTSVTGDIRYSTV